MAIDQDLSMIVEISETTKVVQPSPVQRNRADTWMIKSYVLSAVTIKRMNLANFGLFIIVSIITKNFLQMRWSHTKAKQC